jgi:glycerol-3-phosphate acyltransferase PlsY
MTPLQYLLIAVIAYLLGSFSFGIYLSAMRGKDIRAEGSKSSGATNVTRVLGIKFGLLTFLGDFVKATLAVLIGNMIAGQAGMQAAGIFAVVGHNWPVYYRFKGGKGIVCSVAVLLWVCPPEAAVASALAVITIILTKYVSLGSLVMVGVSSMLIIVSRPFIPLGAWSLILILLAIWQHRANIRRLIRGEESKLKLKK